jgi:hypothetical protein
MPLHPIRLQNFQFRKPDDASDVKLLADVERQGWHVVAVPADHHGPGFAFTVGLYLRTLQPEILIIGVDIVPSGRVLNAIGEYLMAGGQLVPEKRYDEFVDDREVIFRPIHSRHYRDYLGSAIWFYRNYSNGFPALQCFWPDKAGIFPHETGFDKNYRLLQLDLSA